MRKKTQQRHQCIDSTWGDRFHSKCPSYPTVKRKNYNDHFKISWAEKLKYNIKTSRMLLKPWFKGKCRVLNAYVRNADDNQ